MTTVRDIVKAALRKINVMEQGENMPAEMAGEGVFTFNAMLHGWKAHGVDVSHVDQTLDDDFALGDEFVEGAIYLLAARLAPEYSMPAAFDVSSFWHALQAAYAVVPTVAAPDTLLGMPSRRDLYGVSY